MYILKQFILRLSILCLFCTPTYSKDGVLDENFQFTQTELNGLPIKALDRLQCLPNNSILVVASLVKNPNSLPVYCLFRVDRKGKVDNSFIPQEISSPHYAVQTDGKIIVGKYLNKKHLLVRLYSDGSRDNSFEEYNLSHPPLDIKIFRDNEIFIGTLNQVIRITSNSIKATVDPMYAQGASINIFELNNVLYLLKSTSRQIYNTNLHALEWVSYLYITRISDEFILDSRYDLDQKYPSTFMNLFHDDSSIYLCGNFVEKRNVSNNDTDEMYGITKYRIKDGFPISLSKSYDSTFNKPQGTVRGFEKPATDLGGMVINNKLLLFGNFKWYNGEPNNGIVRTEKNGDIDNTFDSGSGVDGTIYSVSAAADNDLFIAGNFTTYNGVPRRFIAKLKGDKQRFQYEWYNNLTIKPNPATDLCTIDNIPFGYSVRITDVIGNTIRTYPPAQQTSILSIDTSAMSSGIYFIYIQDTDGNVMSKILTVEH